MRSFIAIDFNPELKEKLADLQDKLKKHTIKGRWKHIDNFHLTLKFLGNVRSEDKKSIDGKLLEVCSLYKAFRLKFSEIGNFLGNGKIKVLWLGLEGDIARLMDLQKDIVTQMAVLGYKPEKRNYIPHITIGQDLILKEDYQNFKNENIINGLPEIIVNGITLFKSEQIKNKRVYTSIGFYRFKEM